MNEFQAIAVTIALFALRCVLPLALLFAIGYAMTRLANRWETQQEGQPASGAAIPMRGAPLLSASRRHWLLYCLYAGAAVPSIVN